MKKLTEKPQGFGVADLKRELHGFAARFVLPPVSVLNTASGEWQARKNEWHTMFTSSKGRGTNVKASTVAAGWIAAKGDAEEGGSTFDPVLCEFLYKIFCPKGGLILDPFAGGSVRGIVAAHPEVGRRYVGIELRKEQVEANHAQAAELFGTGQGPMWINGDSNRLDTLIQAGENFDMVVACPPYYDLEVYSESAADGSSKQTYEEFMVWYENIFRQCVARLKSNRFVAVVVGEIRDKKTGWYRNFEGDQVTLFTRLGLHFYNRMVLSTPMGSLLMRAGRQIAMTRKIGNSHQMVYVFYKGTDQKDISKDFDMLVGDVVSEHVIGDDFQ